MESNTIIATVWLVLGLVIAATRGRNKEHWQSQFSTSIIIANIWIVCMYLG